MNAAHLHLMLNHIPVIGMVVGLLLLFASLFIKSDSVKKISLLVVLIAAISTVPAYLSGEGAEDVIESIPQIQENLVERHEESAELALVLMGVTGLVAGGAWFLGRWKPQWLKAGSYASLLSGAVALYSAALTANSGGEISHPEIRAIHSSQQTGEIARKTQTQEPYSYGAEDDDDDRHEHDED